MTGTPKTLAARGTWTALVTPFREADASLDYEAIDHLVERQIEAGVDAIVPCGTTGESPTLTHEEHDATVARVVARAAGRIPVVAGTGSNSTSEAVRLTVHAAESGADGALVVCPYYNRPSQRMLVEHFRRVAGATALPVVLYNIPARTGVNLEPESVAEIRRTCPTVVAIKEASGSLEQVARIRALSDIAILSGDDALTLSMAALGATGVVSVASNVAPRLVADAVRSAVEGRLPEARTLHDRLFPLYRTLFREPNPVPVKCALKLLERCSDMVRAPLLPAQPETERALREVLTALGLL